MIGIVSLIATYGQEMGFSVELFPDNHYEYVLSGNAEPFFPLKEMGSWVGKDSGEVAELRQLMKDAIEAAPKEPLKMRPGTASMSLLHELDGKTASCSYLLYDQPPAVKSLFGRILDDVNVKWVENRRRTLSVSAPATAGTYSTVPHVNPRFMVDLAASGGASVCYSNLLNPMAWRIILKPEYLDKAALQQYPMILGANEFSLSEEGEKSPVYGSAAATLDAGKKRLIHCDILRDLKPGMYSIYTQLFFRQPFSLTPDQQKSLVKGTITLDAIKFEVR